MNGIWHKISFNIIIFALFTVKFLEINMSQILSSVSTESYGMGDGLGVTHDIKVKKGARGIKYFVMGKII